MKDKLDNADFTASYAATVGISVDHCTRAAVIVARMAIDASARTDLDTENFLSALTALAVVVRPVTVEHLKASKEATDDAVHRTTAIVIGLIIIAFSLLTFLGNSVAEKIRTDTTGSLAIPRPG